MSETVTVRDVTEATFAADVVEASRTRPVVVDFWAAWCAPCRQLSPMLERMAERYAGEVDVVKVDVDANPGLAQAFRVQGIPAVKAFKGGRQTAEFVGLQPEASIDRFFSALAPSDADRLVAKARLADAEEATDLLRQALATDPHHAGAAVTLARLLADRGDRDEAEELLTRHPGDADAERLLAELRFGHAAAAAGSLDELRERAERGDPEASLALGRALAGAGDHGASLEALLAAVRDPATRDEAREATLQVFAVLGPEHELVRMYRPKLASALF